ncbi:MAG: hypothetical protein ACPMAQ_12300, partial [Phycisphaerae bacterium]
GISFLISVLDAAGDWPVDQRYDVRTVASERLSGSGFEASLFDGRGRLYVRSTRTSGRGMLFEKSSAQSSLNGRWIGGDRRWSGATVQRGVRIVVAHNNTLYIHDAWDSDSASFARSFRAPLSAGQYTDPVAEWSGQVTSDGMRIAGTWIDRPEWYNSADRTAAPAGTDLTGGWSSISLDWNHHDASGDILRMYGTATLTRTGDRLEITERYDDGTTYQVDATWAGDHFEGVWWNAATPADTSAWRGEMIANGSYLHGTWDNGEYSFSAYPLGRPSDVQTQATNTRVVSVDPYENVAATIRDAATNTAATMYRNQTGVSEISVVNADGEYRVTFDERLRPVHASAPGETYAFAWSADSTVVEVTIEHRGVVDHSTITVDFSDARLLGALDYMERETGRDVTPFRQWVAAHPGRVLAIVRGEQAPPMPLPRSAPLGVSIAGIAGGAGPVPVARGLRISGHPLDEASVTEAATIAGLIWAMVAADGAALTAGTVLVSAFFWGLCLLAFLAATLLLAYYINKHLVCDPCTLACFWNCTPLPEE